MTCAQKYISITSKRKYLGPLTSSVAIDEDENTATPRQPSRLKKVYSSGCCYYGSPATSCQASENHPTERMRLNGNASTVSGLSRMSKRSASVKSVLWKGGMFDRINVQHTKEGLQQKLRNKDHEKNILQMNLATLSSRALRLECQLEDVKENHIQHSRQTRRLLKGIFGLPNHPTQS